MRQRRHSAALIALLLAGTAQAQDADAEIGARLSLELNSAATEGAACVLSFVAINGHDSDIDSAVFETVLFDAGGQVERLTLFDFGALPAARHRVRQFAVDGTGCDGLSSILVNGADVCASDTLGPDACTTDIELGSRTDIEVLG